MKGLIVCVVGFAAVFAMPLYGAWVVGGYSEGDLKARWEAYKECKRDYVKDPAPWSLWTAKFPCIEPPDADTLARARAMRRGMEKLVAFIKGSK